MVGMKALRITGHGAPRFGLLLLLAVGCADDTPSTSLDGADDATGTTTTAVGSSTSGGPQATGTSTGVATTTGLDSTETGVDTTAADSGSSSGSSESTGEPNEDPVARDEVYFVRQAAAPLVVDAAAGVLDNDSDPEDTALMVDAFDAATEQGGSAAVMPDGSFEYTPPADFFGNDRFGYTVIDEDGGTDSAIVTITVAPDEIEAAELSAGLGGFVINGAAEGDESGFVVSGGGDVNGDGLGDVLVTAEADGTEGTVWVVFGKADTTAVELSEIAAGVGGFSISGESADDPLGPAAAIVGDINGDGLADIAVGAPSAGLPGRAYLVHGKADGAAVFAADLAVGVGGFSMEGELPGEDAGTSVAGGGDVNGDGLVDLLVGAPDGGPIPGGGRVYVVFGRPETSAIALGDIFAGSGGFAIHGAGFDDNAGATVADARDVNGDGLADVLLGAPLANAGGDNSGRGYVVFGKTGTAVVDLDSLGSQGFAIDGVASFDEAGRSLAGLGDLDGDGLGEVLIGAPNDDGDLLLQGRSYVITGRTETSTIDLVDVAMGIGGFVLDGESSGHLLGLSGGAVGDFDADGLADLLVGAPNAGTPGVFSGRGYVVFGKSDTDPVPLVDLTVDGDGIRLLPTASNDALGWSMAAAGDVNGDGFRDFIVSARRADPVAATNAGRSFVVFGGNYSGAATALGGPGDDLLEGDGSLDVIVAGAGADEVHGGGSSDILYGGAGDDVIGISGGQFFRIDGGTGIDTLMFDDDNVQLDLTLVVDVALRDLEIVDLTGTGDNLLRIELRDLRSLVGSSRTLRVRGTATDTFEADLSGAGFVDQGVEAGVQSWTNGMLTLEVEEPLVGAVTL